MDLLLKEMKEIKHEVEVLKSIKETVEKLEKIPERMDNIEEKQLSLAEGIRECKEETVQMWSAIEENVLELVV